MGEAFDPYRDALVVETTTLWPSGTFGLEVESRRRVERALREQPSQAAELEYVRLPTGFRRQIRVTAADVERILGITVVPKEESPVSGKPANGEEPATTADSEHRPAPAPGGSPAEG